VYKTVRTDNRQFTVFMEHWCKVVIHYIESTVTVLTLKFPRLY